MSPRNRATMTKTEVYRERKQTQRLFPTQGLKCKCGRKKGLERHHVNGCIEDDRPENILIVCVHCHRVETTLKHYFREAS